MATLLLIRHGQASYGQTDYDRLSSRGQDQARALGKHLAAAKLDTLFVGPLKRQQQTVAFAAEIAGAALPPATTLPEFAEYPAFDLLQHFMPKLVAEDPKFAALTSTPTRELADAAFHTILGRWMRDEWQVDGVERVSAFRDRVRAGLDHVLRAAKSGARVAVVTSAGPIGVAVGLTFGCAEERMVRTSLVIRNASITELKFRTEAFAWHPDRISLLTFNQTHHLPPELHTEY
ncbi:MAG: Phosphoglycerate mutase [Myxococcales bacterium]|nr:Phosphoglycerate mutase [Myxococcales bacterium]